MKQINSVVSHGWNLIEINSIFFSFIHSQNTYLWNTEFFLTKIDTKFLFFFYWWEKKAQLLLLFLDMYTQRENRKFFLIPGSFNWPFCFVFFTFSVFFRYDWSLLYTDEFRMRIDNWYCVCVCVCGTRCF